MTPKDHKLQQKIIIQLTNTVTLHRLASTQWGLIDDFSFLKLAQQYCRHFSTIWPTLYCGHGHSRHDDDLILFVAANRTKNGLEDFTQKRPFWFIVDPACKRIKAVLSQILFQTNQFLYLINQPMRMPGVLAPSGSRPGPTLFKQRPGETFHSPLQRQETLPY